MSDELELFVGVDGGGTRTRAIVTDRNGEILSRAEGPAGLVDPRHPERAAKAVAETVGRALSVVPGAGALPGLDSSPPVASLWAGLAGAGDPSARGEVEEALGDLGIARRVQVGTDLQAAFHDAFATSPGILLVVGTGSVALARGGEGGEVRSGGWGGLLGDEGSAYSIGLAAIRASLRARDGRGRDTTLTGVVEELAGTHGVQELAAWARAATKSEIAALAPAVLQAAENGDPLAMDLRDAAVDEIHLLLQAVAHRGGPWREPPSVALVGGLVAPDRPLRQAVLDQVARLGLRASQSPVQPERGAAALARAALSP